MDFNWGADNAPVVFNSSATVFRNLAQALTTSFATLDFTSSTPATLGSEFGYSSGVFKSDPTLLLVGRGLSGKHPLRIGATPEVCRVVLRSS